MQIFTDFLRSTPSEYTRISDTVSVSKLSMSLDEYIVVTEEYCSQRHGGSTKQCRCLPLLACARAIRERGICPMASLYKEIFPGTKYNTQVAKQRLLQTPIAAVRCGDPQSGKSRVFLMESIPGCTHLYQNIIDFYLETSKSANTTPKMSRDHLRQLLTLSQSDRERECIKYAVFKASGLSVSAARKMYGFSDMTQRVDKVQNAIEEARQIRENLESLASIQDRAILLSHGIVPSSSSSSCSSSGGEEEVASIDLEDFKPPRVCQSPEGVDLASLPLQRIVEKSKSNFFQVVEDIEAHFGISLDSEQLDLLFQQVVSLPDSCFDTSLMEQSYRAFVSSTTETFPEERNANSVNGLVVTDSESEDPELLLLETEKQKAIQKQRKILQRKVRRQRAKRIASANFLSRRVSKNVHGIVKKFPNIGKAIEEYVSERNVGADCWRRTGVLTFDGNLDIKEKVTYGRIREHLQTLYKHKFSYGTIVQLCVARNKRRRSAANYRGLAKVTTRRARKGFTLKFNPDSHWSGAFYRGLNWLQYHDGLKILNVNRDDASGFRLDTLATHNQYATPVVGETLTTRTDYVNKYTSVLQTTSYNFSGTSTTPEFCAGVVKPSKVFPKNPAQHAADFKMLLSQPQLQGAFVNNHTGLPKRVACIRVDGAGDEGPGHLEVQYWWTLHHIEAYSDVTLVTTRSSGSSYLNRVELQNGCLSHAHANLFIPSTLNGSCLVGGDIDEAKLKQNLMSAAEVYIKRCDKAPCGDTEINLYIGADSSDYQVSRETLLTFLKGSLTAKSKLRREHPEEYAKFETVWSVRERHMVKNVPTQYVFFLLPCYEASCPHPACKKGKPEEELTWYENGPPISYLPFPVCDVNRAWGSDTCNSCTGFCAGHYLSPEAAYLERNKCIVEPPSQILGKLHKQQGSIAEERLAEIAKDVLLSQSDLKLWVQHLDTIKENRRRGAQKAQETRRRKKQASYVNEYRCGVCSQLYVDETEEEELWIGCDRCQSWFQVNCVCIRSEDVLSIDRYVCPKCQESSG